MGWAVLAWALARVVGILEARQDKWRKNLARMRLGAFSYGEVDKERETIAGKVAGTAPGAGAH